MTAQEVILRIVQQLRKHGKEDADIAFDLIFVMGIDPELVHAALEEK